MGRAKRDRLEHNRHRRADKARPEQPHLPKATSHESDATAFGPNGNQYLIENWPGAGARLGGGIRRATPEQWRFVRRLSLWTGLVAALIIAVSIAVG